MPADSSPSASIISLALVVIAAAVSFPMEARRRERMPRTLPYTWGIYVGVQSGLCGIVLLVLALLQLATTPGAALFFVLIGALYTWAGLTTIQRYRGGFVLATILGLNPIWWIANTIYIRNRWQELQPLPSGTPSDTAVRAADGVDAAATQPLPETGSRL